MAKIKTKSVWYCTECGADSPKWEGRCPSCGAWNTMVEEKTPAKQSKSRSLLGGGMKSRPQKVSEIETAELPRIIMPSKELNRVLGGGLVPGSMVLIGGEPGIGKSTLVLQNTLSIKSRKILYVSGEESAAQLRMRADRLGRVSDNVYIVCETSLDTIFEHIENTAPGMLIVDSIQTDMPAMTSSRRQADVGQVRECSARLLRYAKEEERLGVPVLLTDISDSGGKQRQARKCWNT